MAKKKTKAKVEVVETKAEMVTRLRKNEAKQLLKQAGNKLLKVDIVGQGGIVRASKNSHQPI